MPAPARPALRPTQDAPNLQSHEQFCLPRPGETEPRIERYSDVRDKGNGVQVPVNITRCIECGHQKIEEISHG
jgi:hypothetical protein